MALAGLLVGFVVGLTGMGGGALMTPILVLVFGIDPLTAVSSDLVASLVMKPFGAGVHARRGTVNFRLVRWLCAGSVPAAFLGVVVLNTLAGGDALQDAMRLMLGGVLLLAATSMVVRQELNRRRAVHVPVDGAQHLITVRPAATLVIGLVGGLVVGMTSVGSGSLMIVLLLVLYPTLSAGQLVGTDLVQAIPLVAAAALGHLVFGDVELALTGALLVGAIPGVYVGARISSRAPDHLIRPILVVVLAISGAKLLGLPDPVIVGLVSLAAAVGAAALGVALRRRTRVPVSAMAPAPADPG